MHRPESCEASLLQFARRPYRYRHGQTPLGKDNNPEAKDYRDSVQHLINAPEQLYNAEPIPVVRALSFLNLNGVGAAVGDIETPIQILRITLGNLLYPDSRAVRERSPSPETKRRAMMEEMQQEAEEAKKIYDRKRAAKREREMDAIAVEDGATKTPGDCAGVFLRC